MEISDVRRRLRQAIADARKAEGERRTRHDEAAQQYETFLTTVATPVFRAVESSLKAEGFPFRVSTPAGSVRLASDHSAEDFIEIALDTTGDTPEVMGRISRGRGRRMVRAERPIRGGVSIATMTDEDVLQFLMEEIVAFVGK